MEHIALDPNQCAVELSRRSVIEVDGCWLVDMKPTKNGYIRILLGGRRYENGGVYVMAHRAALVAKLGRDILPGMMAGHTCHDAAVARGECAGGPACFHRRCINPDHIIEMTDSENTRGGVNVGVVCKRGHPRVKGNCPTCAREREALVVAAIHASGLSWAEFKKVHGRSYAALKKVLATA